jgi:spore maturation protein CgeB
MRIAFYGSSLLSAYWNGAATYYRGLLGELASRGWEIVFYEPDAFDRQNHRDIDPPNWARVVVWRNDPAACRAVMAEAVEADVVVKASGVGVFDDALLGVFDRVRPDALGIYWDVDAPATLAEIHGRDDHPLRAILPRVDHVLTYGGGAPVVDAFLALGARSCRPVYNALDPATHRPAPAQDRFRADLSLLANRLPDREVRIDRFFLEPAAALSDRSFLLGGSGWEDKAAAANVRRLGHIGTAEHNAFNCSALAVLNVSRESMAQTGFSPATRVFEAVGAGACLITDAWQGLEQFLEPDTEVLVARDGRDVADHLRTLTRERARTLGDAARRRVLAHHTYAHRAGEVDALFRASLAARRGRSAA